MHEQVVLSKVSTAFLSKSSFLTIFTGFFLDFTEAAGNVSSASWLENQKHKYHELCLDESPRSPAFKRYGQ